MTISRGELMGWMGMSGRAALGAQRPRLPLLIESSEPAAMTQV